MCIVCVKIVFANSLNGTNQSLLLEKTNQQHSEKSKTKANKHHLTSDICYILSQVILKLGRKNHYFHLLRLSISLSNLWPWPSMTFLRSSLPTLSLQGASQHIEATFDQKSIRKQFKLNFSWLPFSLFCIITESLDVFESTGKPINRWLSIIFCKVLMLSVCSAVEKNNGWK